MQTVRSVRRTIKIARGFTTIINFQAQELADQGQSLTGTPIKDIYIKPLITFERPATGKNLRIMGGFMPIARLMPENGEGKTIINLLVVKQRDGKIIPFSTEQDIQGIGSVNTLETSYAPVEDIMIQKCSVISAQRNGLLQLSTKNDEFNTKMRTGRKFLNGDKLTLIVYSKDLDRNNPLPYILSFSYIIFIDT